MDPNAIVFGFLPLGIFLMIAAGVFYVFSALFIWKSSKGDRGDLINALVTFLLYQAVAKFSMAAGAYSMFVNAPNPLYGNIASLAVIIGAAYMLKFPLSMLSMWTRKVLFGLILIASIVVYAVYMGTPEGQAALGGFVVWYDLVLNGLIVGGTIILFGIRTANRLYKTKALGGGSGVISCCVVANYAMLSGAALTSVIFQFLAPILILWSLISTRKQA